MMTWAGKTDRSRFDFWRLQVQKKAAWRLFSGQAGDLFARALVDGLDQFGGDLDFDFLLGLLFEELRFGPPAAVIGNGGLLRQLLNLGEHDSHGVLSYNDMSAFGTFWGWDIFEAK